MRTCAELPDLALDVRVMVRDPAGHLYVKSSRRISSAARTVVGLLLTTVAAMTLVASSGYGDDTDPTVRWLLAGGILVAAGVLLVAARIRS